MQSTLDRWCASLPGEHGEQRQPARFGKSRLSAEEQESIPSQSIPHSRHNTQQKKTTTTNKQIQLQRIIVALFQIDYFMIDLGVIPIP